MIMGSEKSIDTLDVGVWEPTVALPESRLPKRAAPQQDVDLPRLIHALERIDSTPWKPWIKVGLAIKNESSDYFPVWEWWSKRSSNSNGCDLRAEWDKLKPDGSVTLGTIFHLGKVEEQPKFEIFNLDHLLSGDFRVTYLIDGILVAGQPCLCVGPQKSLKTTLLLYMALCLSMGRPFLGRPCTKSRVLFMSGESGLATLQETIVRMLKTLGKHEADHFHLSPNLPRFDQPLDELENLLTELKTEVLFIDPAYLCMAGDGAGNMFEMGQQLKNVADLCTRLGITLVLAHHSTKEAGKKNKPLDLPDMAWAGFAEFARQWLLLSRRKAYRDGTGEHKLYLRAGGSAGHSQLFNLDISEGVHPDRHWDIDTKSEAESVAEKLDQQYEADVTNVREVLKEPMYQRSLRDATGIKSTRWKETLQRMLLEGIIEPATDCKRPRYQLKEK